MPRNDEPQRRRPPFWHRSRLTWVNALGFALTLFLGLWMLLAVFSSFLPKADPLRFPIPLAFVLVLGVAQLATVVLGATVVFGFMWRGADFHTHRPRLYVFFWTCAGLLFYLCQVVTLARFGMAEIPNVSSWAEEVYWGAGPIGLAAFALMTYVNVEIPAEDDGHDEDAWHDHHFEEGWDEEAEYAGEE